MLLQEMTWPEVGKSVGVKVTGGHCRPRALKNVEVQRLSGNGADLERNQLCLGPLLRIDSEREAFSGHPDANALLTREYRRPFVVPAENAV